jgi:hypothetical protein
MYLLDLKEHTCEGHICTSEFKLTTCMFIQVLLKADVYIAT